MRYLSTLGIAALLVLALLAGCGQKGPLYLPGDEEAAEQYDPGNEYEDEEDGDNDNTQGDNDDGAEATPTTSGGEG